MTNVTLNDEKVAEVEFSVVGGALLETNAKSSITLYLKVDGESTTPYVKQKTINKGVLLTQLPQLESVVIKLKSNKEFSYGVTQTTDGLYEIGGGLESPKSVTINMLNEGYDHSYHTIGDSSFLTPKPCFVKPTEDGLAVYYGNVSDGISGYPMVHFPKVYIKSDVDTYTLSNHEDGELSDEVFVARMKISNYQDWKKEWKLITLNQNEADQNHKYVPNIRLRLGSLTDVLYPLTGGSVSDYQTLAKKLGDGWNITTFDTTFKIYLMANALGEFDNSGREVGDEGEFPYHYLLNRARFATTSDPRAASANFYLNDWIGGASEWLADAYLTNGKFYIGDKEISNIEGSNRKYLILGSNTNKLEIHTNRYQSIGFYDPWYQADSNSISHIIRANDGTNYDQDDLGWMNLCGFGNGESKDTSIGARLEYRGKYKVYDNLLEFNKIPFNS